MDIKGPLYGFESNLKINLNPTGLGFMVVPFDIALYEGAKLTYTGLYINFITGKKTAYGSAIVYNEQIFLFWYRFLAGPSWTFLDHYRFNFLSGYGYKYTLSISDEQAGYASRINRFNYVPLVLQFQYRGDVTALLHAEYDILLRGEQETRLTDGLYIKTITVALDELEGGLGCTRPGRNFILWCYHRAVF